MSDAETTETPTAQAAAPAAPAAAGAGKASLPGLMILSLALIVIMHSAFLFLFVALMPAMAAYISDSSPSKATFRCVFFCNFAGTLPYLMAMRYTSIGDVLLMMRDAQMWLVVLSAAALGWGIVWLVPLVMRIVLRLYYIERAQAMAASNKKLAAVWGLEM